ncbi:hypothetical protein CEK25_004515 [Fusarium fujikuroi]|nr:hypothetical protein CEK25_004515 [Fusarium fujikuroi]
MPQIVPRHEHGYERVCPEGAATSFVKNAGCNLCVPAATRCAMFVARDLTERKWKDIDNLL